MIIGKLAKYHYDERAMNLLERESNSSDKSIKSHAQHNKERAAIFKKIDPYLKLIQSVKDEDKIEGYTQIVKELGEDSFNYVKDGIITEETNVRIAIIKLLAPYASKYNISSFLKRFVNDRDGEVRESVRRILYSKAKEVEEKVDKAVKLIEDLRSSTETTKTEDSEITKKKTIIELGKMVGKKSVDSLVKFLKDENATIRGNTAQALGEIGDTKAIKPLEELLETEKNDYVKQGIEKALQQLRKK